ncbi:MAG: bacteriohemerythrin [Prolixibacteraceae bacterium]
MYKWEEKFSVGIQSLDQQHRQLFELINKLLEAMKQGQAPAITLHIILELEKYAMIHFQKEEFFFQRFNYSGAAEHIHEHQLFTKKIKLLKEDLKSGKIVISFELLNFLKNWIGHHIQDVDQKYAECFLKNGLR